MAAPRVNSSRRDRHTSSRCQVVVDSDDRSLFLIGYVSAGMTDVPRSLLGVAIVVAGLALSAVTIWLG